MLLFLFEICIALPVSRAEMLGDEKKMGAFAPQSIGLVVVCGHLFGIPFTGTRQIWH